MKKVWKKHFLRIEFAGGLLLTLGFAVWGFCIGGFKVVDSLVAMNRSEIYGSLATLFGSLLGFVIVSVSIVINYTQNPQFKVIRQSAHYQTLWSIFIAAIRWLGFATLVALVALILDRTREPNRWAMVAVFGSSVLAALRTFRCVWILEKIIQLVIVEGQKEREIGE